MASAITVLTTFRANAMTAQDKTDRGRDIPGAIFNKAFYHMAFLDFRKRQIIP